MITPKVQRPIRKSVRKPIEKPIKEIIENQQIYLDIIKKKLPIVQLHILLSYWLLIPTFGIRFKPFELDFQWLCFEFVIRIKRII